MKICLRFYIALANPPPRDSKFKFALGAWHRIFQLLRRQNCPPFKIGGKTLKIQRYIVLKGHYILRPLKIRFLRGFRFTRGIRKEDFESPKISTFITFQTTSFRRFAKKIQKRRLDTEGLGLRPHNFPQFQTIWGG